MPEQVRRRPIVVQHSFGELGSGGPIGALNRLLQSPLASEYNFVRMHQDRVTGGIDMPRILVWARMLRALRPDLVHIRGLGNEGFHGVLAARAARCQRILVSVHGTVRDLQPPKSIKQRILITAAEPLTLRLATHVTTVCEFAAHRDFVATHSRKFVGPLVNGAPMPVGLRAPETVRRDLGLTDNQRVLATVGRLTWDKGHAVLADALTTSRAELNASRSVLLVVGDGPDRDDITNVYATCGVDVRLLGRRLDVAEILSAADVFVLPSFHENLSNALIEAMSAGLPVVASSVGGNVEVLNKGGGVLVPPGDPSALADAISKLVSAPAAAAALGAAARRNARDNYSVEAMCESIDRVYKQVLGEVAGP